MLRKLAIAMFATTMLAAPVLAADAVKPGVAAAPKAPVATTNTPATATTSKTDTGNPPAANADKSGKGAVTPTATPVKIIKADKHLKTIKVATRSHRHHSHHWYVVHRGWHATHTMTAKLSKPVKHAYVHRLHKHETPVVKANKEAPNKVTQ